MGTQVPHDSGLTSNKALHRGQKSWKTECIPFLGSVNRLTQNQAHLNLHWSGWIKREKLGTVSVNYSLKSLELIQVINHMFTLPWAFLWRNVLAGVYIHPQVPMSTAPHHFWGAVEPSSPAKQARLQEEILWLISLLLPQDRWIPGQIKSYSGL